MLNRALLPALALVLALWTSGCRDPSVAPPPEPDEETLAEAERIDRLEALIDDGAYEDARTLLDEELAAGFEHPMAFMLKARILQQGDDPDRLEEAITWLDRAIDASPGWWEPRWQQAQIFLELRRHRAAATACQSLDRLFPRSPVGPYGLAIVALREAQLGNAEDHLEEALERNPDHVPSLHAMAHLAERRKDQERQRAILQRILVLAPDSSGALRDLGELALEQERPHDALRHLQRSYHLGASSTTARLAARAARQANRSQEAEEWERRAGMAALNAEADAEDDETPLFK